MTQSNNSQASSTHIPFNTNNTTSTDLKNAWLLPDGVHDVLFLDAEKQQYLRHHLIDQLQRYGYQLVTPPLIEFTETLLDSASEDLKRQTFKIIDQLTGRLMGLRADTTPQIQRIDANHNSNSGIARYCYVGHTVHTLPIGLFGLRTPLQLGAEIFGSDDIKADFELLDVLYHLFDSLQLQTKLHLDIGHVGIFKRLSELANLSNDDINQLMQLYENKALSELKNVCVNLPMGNDFLVIAKYGNDLDLLKIKLSEQAISDTKVMDAINELHILYKYLFNKNIKSNIESNVKNNNDGINGSVTASPIDISIDVSHLSGYNYHSGIMFNMYLNSGSQPLVRGGRFYGINKKSANTTHESTTRPAIGFSMDVTRLLPYINTDIPIVILVEYKSITSANEQQYQLMLDKVAQLRSYGKRVIIPLSVDDQGLGVTHYLRLDDEWHIDEV